MGLIPLKAWLGLAVLAALAGLLFHDHMMSHRYKAERQKTDELQATIKSERKAKVAEVAHVQENADTTQLRADNPLHGGLCVSPSVQARAAKRLDAGPSTASADIQQVPEGDTEPSGQPNPDIRHMLDILAARGDELSAQVREFQNR